MSDLLENTQKISSIEAWNKNFNQSTSLKSWSAFFTLLVPFVQVLTFALVLFATSFAYFQLQLLSRSQEASRASFNKQQETMGQEIAALRETIKQQATATVYGLGADQTRQFVQYPHLRKFFDGKPNYFVPINEVNQAKKTKEYFAEQSKAAKMELESLSPIEQAQVWSMAEHMADFIEFIYTNRQLLNREDWASWWNYIEDQYDMSPVLRAYCDHRGGHEEGGWYRFVDKAKLPPNLRARIGLNKNKD